MKGFDALLIWPDNIPLSVFVLLLLAIPLLYAARVPAHGALRFAARALSNPMRLGARWLQASAIELRERNRVVLLAHGREEVGQQIAREFERVSALVKRDLNGYPALQRKLLDEITRIEEDYQKCNEVPPPSPDWVEALSAVAKIKGNGNEMVMRILEEIKASVRDIHDQALNEYRRAYESRHRILKGFMPFWRSVDTTMAHVDKKLTGLQDGAKAIDEQMKKYEQINAKTDKAEQMLAHSAFVQFFIATVVMAIVLGGALINFKLIALPMSEMVGASDYLTTHLRTSEVAALVIIFLEAAMGLFLMESLRITHLFPRIGNMEDKMRRRMIVASLVFLVILAGVEAALALMRDMLIADKQALLQTLSATPAQVQTMESWVTHIPTAGQMILGFVLPFILAFIAIPLETFIYTARTVVGVALVVTMRSIAFVLRFASLAVRQIGVLLVMLYDVLIFAPLMIERSVKALRRSALDDESERALHRAR